LLGGQPAVPPIVQQALRKAHQHTVSGEYDDAIRIYRRLAAEAYNRGRVRPGVQMELEATRVQLAARQFEAAVNSALHALKELLNRNIVPAAILPVIEKICVALIAGGEKQAAEDFRANVDKLLTSHGLSLDALKKPATSSDTPAGEREKLPEVCPSCFAPLHADEMTWTEPGRTQCTYCGRPINVI
jgi:hypothetical protein